MVDGEGSSPFVNPRKHRIKNMADILAGTYVPTMNIPGGPCSDGLLTTRMARIDLIASDRSDESCHRSDISLNPDGFAIPDVACGCTRCAHFVAIGARYEISD